MSLRRLPAYWSVFLLLLFAFRCEPGLGQAPQNAEQLRLDSLKQVAEARKKQHQLFLKKQHAWADSVLQTLSLKERIGQLYMVQAYSNQSEKSYAAVEKLIREYKIGGLIFFQGSPHAQAVLTNRYQAASKLPLFLAMDAEWGLGMRLDSTISFPRQMVLGASRDSASVYAMGREVARQLRRLGVHINFAPVVDVNSNPKNPVIGTRSFGENKHEVARLGGAYTKGLQHGNVLACMKHFPGHGDTDSDSHYSQPVLRHDRTRLDSLELYPFRKLLGDSVMSTMVAHLHIPAYDSTPNRPTTLAPAVVTGLLRDSLGFEGLAFTDAMNMKGLADHFGPGEADVQALLAGNDVLLYPGSVPKGVTAIEKALKDSVLTEAQINAKVLKILKAKYWANLHKMDTVKLEGLYEDIHQPAAYALNNRLHQRSITVLRNPENFLPVRRPDTLEMASLVIGKAEKSAMQKQLSVYGRFEHYQLGNKNASKYEYAELEKKLAKKDFVVIGLHGVNTKSVSSTFGISTPSLQFIERLSAKTKVAVVVYGLPYAMRFFEEKPQFPICANVPEEAAQIGVAEAIFGAKSTEARLPVSASEKLPEGTGVSIQTLGRLGFQAVPEEVQMDSEKLKTIDQLAQWGIDENAYPGAQVFVARRGQVVYHKSFGHQTYDKKKEVTAQTVYDLASLTKVLATAPTLMHLVGNEKIAITDTVSSYLREMQATDKKSLTFQQILTHEAGLFAHMPGWRQTLADPEKKELYYAQSCSDSFCIAVTDTLFAYAALEDSLWQWALRSYLYPQRKSGRYPYKYSDIGFFVLKRASEYLLGKSLAAFTQDYFYTPLGLSRLGYHPLWRVPRKDIAPTEYDLVFRGGLIQGVVHDYTAAMTGGVGGHAGLFSNAWDVGTFAQMLLEGGKFLDKEFLQEKIIKDFSEKQFPGNRRALAWDKPRVGRSKPVPANVSPESYGHKGFTGTYLWIDPKEELVYVFLCNRIYPSSKNWKLQKLGIREQIHALLYEAMLD